MSRSKRTKGGSKGDKDVPRNLEGVAITEHHYKAGEVTIGSKDLAQYYKFNLEQLEFLKEYAKDVDAKRAAAAVGVPKRTMDRWMGEEKFRAEIMEIHDVWRLNIKMTAESAAASHIKLMQKLNKDYDHAEPELRAKFANPLVKASETYLKAAGHMTHGKEAQDTQVVINIDLGGDAKNEQKVSISGERPENKVEGKLS